MLFLGHGAPAIWRDEQAKGTDRWTHSDTSYYLVFPSLFVHGAQKEWSPNLLLFLNNTWNWKRWDCLKLHWQVYVSSILNSKTSGDGYRKALPPA